VADYGLSPMATESAGVIGEWPICWKTFTTFCREEEFSDTVGTGRHHPTSSRLKNLGVED